MPAVPSATSVEASPPPPAPAPQAAADGDFAAKLAAATQQSGATKAPGDRPSVSLGRMIEAFATSPALGAPSADAQPAPPAGAPAAGAATPAAGASWAAGGGAGAKVIAAGEKYLGVPYKWGGTSASTGFDCSGFVQQAYADIGVKLPRVSVDQAKAGEAVASLDQARPGDLIFWRASGGRPNHIAIYAGDGEMLVAPSTGDVVKYQDVSRTPHAIRRIV